MYGFSLRGRELERGVGQNNNYSMPIFEVKSNVVTEGYVRSTPLSHIRNTRYPLVNDCDLSLGEVSSSIQSNPSPEFLNSLPFIKKFYPTPRWGEGYFTKTTHENSSNLRHSERLAKNLRNIAIRFFGLKLLLSSE